MSLWELDEDLKKINPIKKMEKVLAKFIAYLLWSNKKQGFIMSVIGKGKLREDKSWKKINRSKIDKKWCDGRDISMLLNLGNWVHGRILKVYLRIIFIAINVGVWLILNKNKIKRKKSLIEGEVSSRRILEGEVESRLKEMQEECSKLERNVNGRVEREGWMRG